MKIIFTREGQSFFYKDSDLHTKYGVLRKEDIENAKPGAVLATNTGKEMIISEATFTNQYRRLKRNAQIMLSKDICAIVAETGINSKSVVLDSGSGSGALACFLGRIVKKVYSYELRLDHIKTVEENIKWLGLKNIIVKNKDVYLGIDEKKLDCVIFDLPEPWRAVESAKKALKHGGYLVSYSPHITQAKQFVEEVLDKKEFLYLKTIEIIEREWELDKVRARPKFDMLGHTGFLSFARKY